MKKTPIYSKSFKDVAIALPICEILLLFALTLIKKSIVKNEFAYGHSIDQAYILYLFIYSGIVLISIMPYLDYKNLVKQRLTTPAHWKRVYIISLTTVTLIISLLITLYGK